MTTMTKEQTQKILAEKFYDEFFDIFNDVDKNLRNLFVKNREKVIKELIKKMNEKD